MAQLHFVVRFCLIFSARWALLKPLTEKNVAYCEDLTVHGLTSAIIDKRDGHYDMKIWGPWMPMFLMSSQGWKIASPPPPALLHPPPSKLAPNSLKIINKI